MRLLLLHSRKFIYTLLYILFFKFFLSKNLYKFIILHFDCPFQLLHLHDLFLHLYIQSQFINMTLGQKHF